MSTKKVQIGARPSNKPAPADAWVDSRGSGEQMKRLTIDVTEKLHRQIKTACARRGSKIADEIREMLFQKYGTEGYSNE